MRFWHGVVLLVAASLLGSCTCSSPPTTSSTQATSTAAAPRKTRLVVAIVLDQVGTSVLERYIDHLSPNGMIRTAIATGAFHHRVRYTHANTYTAPGHAAIFTGAPPRISGIMGNRVWDANSRSVRSVVDDHTHAVFGLPQEFAGPSMVLAEGVGDVLKRETQNRGRVVSISLKDRCGVIPAGHHPDAAIWYDEEAHAFTTSNYYAESLPSWLTRWQSAHPTSSYFRTWELANPALTNTVTNGQNGAGDWHGLGASFPHNLATAAEPYAAVLATPFSTEMLIDVAKEAVRAYQLGADEVPDLLAVSVSGTDYVGHVFGAESPEAFDNLMRVDAMLGDWLRTLATQTDLSVLITADHGVATRPEITIANGHASFRVEPSEIEGEVEAALDAELGEGTWVDRFVQPLLYLNASAKTDALRPRAIATAVRVINRLDGVHGAYDVRESARGVSSNDALTRAVANGTYPQTRGDIFVAPARNSFIDEQMPHGHGTSHGSPWEYDTDVPVLVYGVGVTHLETREPIAATHTAPTLSTLLSISAPAQSVERDPLPGVNH